jgi:hypothetical protein
MVLEMTTRLPSSLMMASIKDTSISVIKLLLAAIWMGPPHLTHILSLPTLEVTWQHHNPVDQWALSWLVSSDNGHNAAEAI